MRCPGWAEKGSRRSGLIGLCPVLSEVDITHRVRLAGKCGCELCLQVEMHWVTRGQGPGALQGSPSRAGMVPLLHLLQEKCPPLSPALCVLFASVCLSTALLQEQEQPLCPWEGKCCQPRPPGQNLPFLVGPGVCHAEDFWDKIPTVCLHLLRAWRKPQGRVGLAWGSHSGTWSLLDVPRAGAHWDTEQSTAQLVQLPMAVSSAFPILPLPRPAATLNSHFGINEITTGW